MDGAFILIAQAVKLSEDCCEERTRRGEHTPREPGKSTSMQAALEEVALQCSNGTRAIG